MKNIITFFATGFYSGLSPFAPGTVGTIIAAIFFYFLSFFFKDLLWLSGVLFVLTTFCGLWLANVYEKMVRKEDPQEVVIDEWAGYYLTYFLVLFFLPNSLLVAILVFISFRIMDIVKPFPINLSQKFSGGFGIMVDDLLAAIYASLIVILLGRWML